MNRVYLRYFAHWKAKRAALNIRVLSAKANGAESRGWVRRQPTPTKNWHTVKTRESRLRVSRCRR
jgi:hypothetical protein